jgi:hypothetical protein
MIRAVGSNFYVEKWPGVNFLRWKMTPGLWAMINVDFGTKEIQWLSKCNCEVYPPSLSIYAVWCFVFFWLALLWVYLIMIMIIMAIITICWWNNPTIQRNILEELMKMGRYIFHRQIVFIISIVICIFLYLYLDRYRMTFISLTPRPLFYRVIFLQRSRRKMTPRPWILMTLRPRILRKIYRESLFSVEYWPGGNISRSKNDLRGHEF